MPVSSQIALASRKDLLWYNKYRFGDRTTIIPQEVSNMDKNSLAYTTWECKYHIVFAPKYRRKIIYNKLRADIGRILSELCKRKEVLGSNTDGKKELLTIQVGDNESSKYWLSVLNELKNRGVRDLLVICADGLTGIKEAIGAAFPKTEYQRCIVHQVRNTLKYIPDKDRKAFATDLKTIYQASDEKKALAALEQVTEKWTTTIRNWAQVYGELSIMYEGRLPE